MVNKVPTQKELAEQWSEITILRWKERMKELKIGHTGALENSFGYSVMLDQFLGIKKIDLGFLFYGKFVDMGVGKGLGIESVKDNRSRWAAAAGDKINRRAKKWYSPVFHREYNILNEKLQEYYQIDILNKVVSELKSE